MLKWEIGDRILKTNCMEDRGAMYKYCKAYLLKDLRAFSGWHEKSPVHQEEKADEMICFLRDDFTVVKDPIQDQEVLFNEVTPEWVSFCQTRLQFEIPKDTLRHESLTEGMWEKRVMC
jgi:hypothetical protein